MPQFALILTGDKTDLELVIKGFKTPFYSIQKKDSIYILVLDDLDELQNLYNIPVEPDDSVHRKYQLIKLGKEILKEINSTASLKEGSFRNIDVNEQGYYEFDNDMKVIKHVHFQDEFRLGLQSLEDREINKIMESMNKNDHFKQAMYIFSKGKNNLTFSDLYNIKELFEQSSHTQDVLDLLPPGAKRKLSNLGLVAQSVKAVGDEARHRRPGYDNHFDNAGNPSTDKNEYTELVRDILNQWANVI